jgi:hypothetical protein
MPSIEVDEILRNLPHLKTFVLDNVEDFKEQTLKAIASNFLAYEGLESLGLELLTFDLEANKELILDIIK